MADGKLVAMKVDRHGLPKLPSPREGEGAVLFMLVVREAGSGIRVQRVEEPLCTVYQLELLEDALRDVLSHVRQVRRERDAAGEC